MNNRGARICASVVAVLAVVTVIALWSVLLSTSHARHSRDSHDFTLTFGNGTYGFKLAPKADLSDIRIEVAVPAFEFDMPLTFLLLFQMQVILLLWWRIKLKEPEWRLATLTKRLITATGVTYALCLVTPTAEDTSDPISGLGLIRYWLATVFQEFRPEWNDMGDVAENIRFLWLLPVILGPPLLLTALFLEAPLRHTFGIITATILSINVLILTTNTFLGTEIEFTYGISLLGLANAFGALAVLTKVVESRRFDAKWQATLEEAPM